MAAAVLVIGLTLTMRSSLGFVVPKHSHFSFVLSSGVYWILSLFHSKIPTMGGKGKKTKSATPAPVKRRTRKQTAAKLVSPPGSPILREQPSDVKTGPTPDAQTAGVLKSWTYYMIYIVGWMRSKMTWILSNHLRRKMHLIAALAESVESSRLTPSWHLT